MIDNDEERTVKFVFSVNQEKQSEENQEEEDNLGVPTIKYGDAIVFIRHVDSDLWISYETLQLTIKGIGKVEEKRVEKSDLFSSFEISSVRVDYPSC